MRTLASICLSFSLALLGCSPRATEVSDASGPGTAAAAPRGAERAVDELAAFPAFASQLHTSTGLRASSNGFEMVKTGGGALSATLPARSRGALRLSVGGQPDAWIELIAEDVRDVPGVESKGAIVYPDAVLDGDIVEIAAPDRLEEVRILRSPVASHTARMSLRHGPAIAGVRVREGRVECLDASGRVTLGSAPMFAIDARGVRRTIVPELLGSELRWSLDAHDLVPPIAVDPAWTTMAVMKVPRSSHVAERMSDGRVLVTGGTDGVAVLSSAEIYDPVANTWTLTTSMSKARVDHAMSRMKSGKVMAIGYEYSTLAEVYDPIAKTWTALPNPSICKDVRAYLLPSGKVLVLDCNGFTRFWDESTSTWTSGADMLQGRYRYGSALMNDGRVLIVGGEDYYRKNYSTAEIYDPITDKWTATGARSVRGQAAVLTTLPSGKVLAVGGRDAGGFDVSVAELFDPSSGTWSALPSLSMAPYGPITGVLGPGHALVFSNSDTTTGTVEVLDESRSRWAKASANTAVTQAFGTTLSTGEVLIMGGSIFTGSSMVRVGTTTKFKPVVDGTSCSSTLPGDCASTFCVDGVCCNGSCDLACQQCDVSGSVGKCSGLTGAPHAGRTCDPYASCVAGSCASSCTADTDCAASSYCAASKCVPKKSPGASCSATKECASGNCVDGVCCDTTCTGQCEACDVAGSVGTCAPVVGTPKGTRPACTDGGKECGQVCDGKTRSSCVYLPGGTTPCSKNSCDTGIETHASTCDGTGKCSDVPKSCGAYACSSLSCKTACATKADCAAGHLCALGACIVAPGLGAPCKDGSECSTGYCVDGVCCGVASCGAGSTCAAPTKAGTCTKLLGLACLLGDECASGKCVDGVCCDADCTGQCAACNVPGQVGKCVAAKGKARGGRPACASEGGNPCGEALCDGSDASKCATFVKSEVSCRPASCKDGEATEAASCDGTGKCPAAIKKPCGGYACSADGKACRLTCAKDEDCASTHTCKAGTCAPRAATCSADYSSRIAIDGTSTSCAPYRCRAGECPSTCGSSADCLPGTVCDGTQCVPPNADSGSSGGCTTSPRGGWFGAPWLLSGAVLASFLRRRRRLRSVGLPVIMAIVLSACASSPPPTEERRIDSQNTASSEASLEARAVVAELSRFPALAARVGAFRPAAAHPLAVEVPSRSTSPLRIAVRHEPELWAAITPLAIDDASGERVDGTTVYRGVAPEVDLIQTVDAAGVEEIRLMRAVSTPRIALAYRLETGPAVREVRTRGGRVELVDASGRARIGCHAMWAFDAAGKSRALSSSLEREGDHWLLRAELATEGLVAPIAIDPAWSTLSDTINPHQNPWSLVLGTGDVVTGGGSYEDRRTDRWSASSSTWSDVSHDTSDESTAVLLSSGKPFLVAMDWATKGPTGFLYDPGTSLWSYRKGPAVLRTHAPLILLPSGKVLAAGGYDNWTGFVPYSSSEIYDPSLDSWSAGPTMTMQLDPVVVSLSATKTLFAGGFNASSTGLSTAQIYDASGNTFSAAASMNEVRRYGAHGVRLASGKIFVVGGAASGIVGSTTAEIYDPAANTWTYTAPTTIGRLNPVVALLPSGRVLVAGGIEGDTTAHVYDPVGDKWLLAGKSLLARPSPGFATISGGRILVFGGWSSKAGFIFDTEIFQEQPNGGSCTGPGECTSGNCVDGYCCNSPCGGACQACSVSGKLGTCSPISGPPLAGHPACAPYAACVSGACASSCASDADCCGTFDTCCKTSICSGFSPSYCGSSGTCVAKKANGAACTKASECASDNCVDSVCCDKPCAGQCEACNETGSAGTCVAVVGAPRAPRAVCSGGVVGGDCGLHCDGSNRALCVFPPAAVTKCSADGCSGGVETHVSSCDGVGKCNDVPKTCGAFACVGTKCATTCTTLADCAAGFVCKTGACVPAPGLGMPCSSTAPCTSPLFCTDGVCCGVSACGAGKSCAMPATKGTCAKVDGETCTSDPECGSGACVDGYCCESRCDGQCQACDLAGSFGKCVAVKGAPHGKRIACSKGDPNVCETTVCDGTDGSRCAGLAASETTCRAAKCVDGAATGKADCDGAGGCPSPSTVPCAPYKCDAAGAACTTSCKASDDCAPGYVCKDAKCVKAERKCADDGLSVVDPEGKATSCAPFRCKDSACVEKCTSSDECAGGTACSDGRCIPPVLDTASTDSGGGCVVGRSAAGLEWSSVALLSSALVVLRRRRRRAHFFGGLGS